jgi:hypothetical protein
LTFWTDKREVLNVLDLREFNIEAGSMEPLIAGITANHFNRFGFVTDAVQLIWITLNN